MKEIIVDIGSFLKKRTQDLIKARLLPIACQQISNFADFCTNKFHGRFNENFAYNVLTEYSYFVIAFEVSDVFISKPQKHMFYYESVLSYTRIFIIDSTMRVINNIFRNILKIDLGISILCSFKVSR